MAHTVVDDVQRIWKVQPESSRTLEDMRLMQSSFCVRESTNLFPMRVVAFTAASVPEHNSRSWAEMASLFLEFLINISLQTKGLQFSEKWSVWISSSIVSMFCMYSTQRPLPGWRGGVRLPLRLWSAPHGQNNEQNKTILWNKCSQMMVQYICMTQILWLTFILLDSCTLNLDSPDD